MGNLGSGHERHEESEQGRAVLCKGHALQGGMQACPTIWCLQGSYEEAEDGDEDKKCKDLAEAFCSAVKNGRLFNAFSAANRRFKLGKELDEKVNELFDEYMADPDNEEKLKALEEIEMEIAQSQDYTTAGGDVEMLKELDHHNDLDKEGGLVVFDLCTRGVATQEVQTTMQAIRPHNR